MRYEWHSMPMDEMLALLGTTQDGLSHAEVKLRLKKIGMNRLEVHQGPSIFKIFIRQFFNPLVLILLAAAILKFSLADILNGSVLTGTIGIMAFIGFFQEVRAVRAMKALQKLSAHYSKVKRSDHNQLVLSETLVPGDLLILEAGDKIPADARLLDVSNFKVNESTLTGESNAVEKHTAVLQGNPLLGERKNMVYMGTIVACGKALAIITSTGLFTELGKIAATMQGEKEKKTPLQSNIDFIGLWMLCIVFIAVMLFVCVGLYRGMDWLEVFLLAVAAAVCAIPEGLPAAVTICLASGVNAMAKKQAIIRKLIAVETLGSTTIICSDKTGTLTLNQLTVKYLYTLEGLIRSEDLKNKADFAVEEVLKLGVLCNDALLTKEKDAIEILGDPTEGALLKVAADFGIHREALEVHYPRLDTIPFASENLYMATLHATEGSHKVIVKGAPEKLLSLSGWVLKNNQVIALRDCEKELILSSVNKMADQTYRVIAICFCDNPSQEGFLDEAVFKDKLIFAGFFAMIDPLREDAVEAIEKCQLAGVKVVMMTGDNIRTAEAIAEQMKMKHSSVMCGDSIRNLNDEELKNSIQNVQVFARVEPLHKLRIVKAFQALGHVVAVTGDGVNDAPALEAADIGIAMGKMGTDVAKEAADMVLADDNFVSIVAAIEEGRAIFNRLRNVCAFLLITCFGELLGLILSVLFTGHSPLLPLQILWVNLITGVIVAIPIALEPKQGDELKQPPRDGSVRLIFTGMLWQIGFLASLLGLSIFFVFEYMLHYTQIATARTMVLSSIVIFEWLIAYNSRSDDRSIFKLGIFKNKLLVIAIGCGVLLQVSITYCPLFYPLFHMVPLSWKQWMLALLPGVVIFSIETIRKSVFPNLFSYGKWKKG